MTKFFFHIRHRDVLVEDEEGLDLAGINEARLEARNSAADLIAAQIRSGHGVCARTTIEVADEYGRRLGSVDARQLLH